LLKTSAWPCMVESGMRYMLTDLTGRDYHPRKPLAMMIEPSSRCNLKCPLCAAGAGLIKREKTELDFDIYRRLIDTYSSSLLYILLFNQGEPFINRDFLEMVDYARRRRIYTITSTNGHYIKTMEKARDIVKSGLDEIRVSLDGLTAEVYNRYRLGGDFNRVIEGIGLLVKAKKEIRSFTPIIEIQILLTSDTEKQINKAREFGKQLGADMVSVKTLQLLDGRSGAEFLPEDDTHSRYERTENGLSIRGRIRNRCRRLYFQMQVNSDGRVVPCCFDKDGRFVFGNISNGNLPGIWRGGDFRSFRKRILRNRKAVKMCNNCTEGLDELYFKRWYI
jgi:radical SAM protein with 4Fe4S-binding SPASM domain